MTSYRSINRQFTTLATELGLTPPERPHRIHGLAFTSLPEATAERYPYVIARLAEAATSFRTVHIPMHALAPLFPPALRQLIEQTAPVEPMGVAS